MSQSSDTVSLRITLRYKNLDEFVDRYAENVSAAGLFIRTKSPKPTGTKIRFELLLADGSRALRGEGVVVTIRKEERPGMALRFNQLDPESQEVIDKVVAAHGQGTLAPTPLSTTFARAPSTLSEPRRLSSIPGWRPTAGPTAWSSERTPTSPVLPRNPSRVFDQASKPIAAPRTPSGEGLRQALPRRRSSVSRPWALKGPGETTDRIRLRDPNPKFGRDEDEGLPADHTERIDALEESNGRDADRTERVDVRPFAFTRTNPLETDPMSESGSLEETPPITISEKAPLRFPNERGESLTQEIAEAVIDAAETAEPARLGTAQIDMRDLDAEAVVRPAEVKPPFAGGTWADAIGDADAADEPLRMDAHRVGTGAALDGPNHTGAKLPGATGDGIEADTAPGFEHAPEAIVAEADDDAEAQRTAEIAREEEEWREAEQRLQAEVEERDARADDGMHVAEAEGFAEAEGAHLTGGVRRADEERPLEEEPRAPEAHGDEERPGEERGAAEAARAQDRLEDERRADEEARLQKERRADERRAEEARLEEEERRAEEEARLDDQRLAEERRAEEEARLVDQRRAEEEARLQEERRAEEEARLVDQRRAEERRAEEEARLVDQRHAEEQARLDDQRRAEEEARLREERRAEEEARLDDQRRAEEEARLDDQRRAEEEARLREERRAEEEARLEDQRRAEERRAEEEARLDDERRAEEEARLDDERRAEEEARRDEERRAQEEARRADARRPDERRAEEEARLDDERQGLAAASESPGEGTLLHPASPAAEAPSEEALDDDAWWEAEARLVTEGPPTIVDEEPDDDDVEAEGTPDLARAAAREAESLPSSEPSLLDPDAPLRAPFEPLETEAPEPFDPISAGELMADDEAVGASPADAPYAWQPPAPEGPTTPSPYPPLEPFDAREPEVPAASADEAAAAIAAAAQGEAETHAPSSFHEEITDESHSQTPVTAHAAESATEVVEPLDARVTPAAAAEVSVTGVDASRRAKSDPSSVRRRLSSAPRVIVERGSGATDAGEARRHADAAFSEEATLVPPEQRAAEEARPGPIAGRSLELGTGDLGGDRIVGIDLGGRWIRIGVIDKNELELIPVGDAVYVPALAAIRRDGSLAFGSKALAITAEHPSRGVSPRDVLHALAPGAVNPNRAGASRIRSYEGGSALLEIGDQTLSLHELMVSFFRWLRSAVEEHLHTTAFRAMISVPHDLDPEARMMMKRACTDAGLRIARLESEPNAAIRAYNLFERPVDHALLVDFGASHLAIALLKRGRETFGIAGHEWFDDLSARDLDSRVADLTLEELKVQAGEDHTQDPIAKERLIEAAEKARLDIRRAPTIELKVTLHAPGGAAGVGVERTINLPRSRIYQMTEQLIGEICARAQRLSREGGVDPRALGAILIAGSGGTYPPLVQSLQNLTSIEPLQSIPPSQLFAHGLARSGLALERQESAARSGALEASIGLELPGGRFRALLNAGDKLPARLIRPFPTRDGQSEVDLRLYQGDAEFVRSCRSPGRPPPGRTPAATSKGRDGDDGRQRGRARGDAPRDLERRLRASDGGDPADPRREEEGHCAATTAPARSRQEAPKERLPLPPLRPPLIPCSEVERAIAREVDHRLLEGRGAHRALRVVAEAVAFLGNAEEVGVEL